MGKCWLWKGDGSSKLMTKESWANKMLSDSNYSAFNHASEAPQSPTDNYVHDIVTLYNINFVIRISLCTFCKCTYNNNICLTIIVVA